MTAQPASMWTKFLYRADFITQLCASVPGSSSLIEPWLKARKATSKPPQGKSLDEVAEEVISSLAQPTEEAEPVGLIFQRVDGVLAVRCATWKAHWKDCAYQIQTYIAGYAQGEKSFRTKVANGIYFPPSGDKRVIMLNGTPFVPIRHPDGTPVTEPSGIREKAIHIQTAQGPRSALKAFEYVEDAVIEIPMLVLTAPPRQVRKGKGPDGKPNIEEAPGRPVINKADLTALAMYGGVHGYGGERSEDGGRYVATITQEEG